MIISKQNSYFKLLRKLSTDSKVRRETSLFLAEGKRFLEYKPKQVFSLPEKEIGNGIVLSKELFKEISSLENSEGYISIFEMNRYSFDDAPNRVVIADRIQDPGNLGTLMRSMDAFGFDVLLLTKGTCDPYNPKCVRASMGSIMNLKIYFLDEDDNAKLQKYFFLLTDSKGNALKDVDKLERFAIVFGNESFGIDKSFSKFSSMKIGIPIQVDSLNVAVAASIFLHDISNRLKLLGNIKHEKQGKKNRE